MYKVINITCPVIPKNKFNKNYKIVSNNYKNKKKWNKHFYNKVY
jgi:hypothetical protein